MTVWWALQFIMLAVVIVVSPVLLGLLIGVVVYMQWASKAR